MALKVDYNFKGLSVVDAHVRIDEIVIRRRRLPGPSWGWRVLARVKVFANKATAAGEVFSPEGDVAPSVSGLSLELVALNLDFMWDRQATPGIFNAVEAYILSLPEFSTAVSETD